MSELSIGEVPKKTEKVISIAKRLHEQGFLASADGNISFLDESGGEKKVYITPSGIPKKDVTAESMACLDISGETLSGKPSSEKLMHLTIYQNSDSAKAVVHAHPPHCIAWSIARPDWKFLPAAAMSELILAVGDVPIVPYARPSTQDMGDFLLPFLAEHRAMILARHGVLCWGETLEEAYNGVERIEHAAKILMLAQNMGGITSLPDEEVSALREMRKKIGNKTL